MSEDARHSEESAGQDVEIAPLESRGTLCGFLLLGRWPENTVEWAKFLVLAVRMAAVPGLLPTSTVYAVHDELTDRPHPNAVGIITAAGQVVGKDALKPGALAAPRPHGLVVLHPPSHTIPSDPEFDTAAEDWSQGVIERVNLNVFPYEQQTPAGSTTWIQRATATWA